jgi:16S rRNA (uracil1498-N3)-methyltransferase
MPPRFFVDPPLAAAGLTLPERATRHVQVLRLQPGDSVMLFDGTGGQWSAQIVAIGRRGVQVQVIDHSPRECEIPIEVTLALAMPANDRMDALVEKATELGAIAIVPLLTERSVLRLAGERAERRQAHWQAIATASCEQCGRNRVPLIRPIQAFTAWLAGLSGGAAGEARLLLGWREAAPWTQATALPAAAVTLLSGPEGGFSDVEEDVAHLRGFVTVSLGPRVLRADTAPLAALAALALRAA